MKFQRLSFFFTSASFLLLVVFGYQNCSRAHFTSDLEGAVLKAEALPPDGSQQGDDGVVGGDPVSGDDGSSPTCEAPPKGNGKKDVASSSKSDLVECQMLHPNKKVILSYELLVQHGNSSSVRVCMSTNACLKLINAFAVQHSCSLDASAPAAQADSQRQCTEIFPGSKGTCNNATVLSDAQVSELLSKLEASK